MYRGAVVSFDSGGTGTLRMKDGMTYKFGGYGLLVEQSDRYGNSLRFVRDAYTNLTNIVDGKGQTLVTISYAPVSRAVISQVTDFTGRKVTYTYDYVADPGTGRLMSVTNPEGGITQYQYDGQGRIASIVDPRIPPSVSYDANGRVCRNSMQMEERTNSITSPLIRPQDLRH
jgi:YD repeat-containing protein